MSRFVVGATWDDVPHLSETAKADLWASIPPYQRDARTRGIPLLGAGAIYPLAEAEITCASFTIPPTWRRGFGMDVGWNRTAGAWCAEDPSSGVKYLYSEYSQGEEKPVVHAQGWKARGLWIPGRIDPAAKGRSQVDGQQLLALYRKEGLRLDMAQNAVETGILVVWTALSTGQLKVFRLCKRWLSEFRGYKRNARGQIRKQQDHLMDATRYALAGGTDWWEVMPKGWRPDGTIEPDPPVTFSYDEASLAQSWMA